MKIGKVAINLFYIVDLDNPVMIERAISFILDDIVYAVKTDTVDSYIDVLEEPTLSERDIHPALCDEEEKS